MVSTDPQAAPGELERVRALLNTWRIPNDTRTAVDELERYAGAGRTSSARDVKQLRSLRDDLRRVVEGELPVEGLNPWIRRLGVRPRLATAAGPLHWEHEGGPAGEALTIVLAAIAAGAWPRLKACPDCRWVFYDPTRNGKKRWCLMNASETGGRACGTLDKVRRFRARQRDAGDR